jgi:Ti-type conjugative transfer relaxase TraA
MAIGFAHPEYVSRSAGANACCKSAYNARDKIKDLNTGVIYNWQRRSDNVYHDILLPDHVDKKFKNAAVLANEVERTEKKCNSQLYVEWLLALPKEENVSLELKLEMVNEFIKRKGWINEGLGVQVDIHKPHGDDINWHAHLLVTTRRFTEDGKRLGAKARDLQPEVKYGKVQKTPEIDNNIFWRDVQNDKFKEHGMPNRVDLNGEITQEHTGPVRMRSILNESVIRNEERKFANIESLKTGADVIERVTKYASIFNVKDLERAVKCIPSHERAADLVLDALNSDQITALYHEGGGESGFYTTAIVRADELKLMRLGGYIEKQKNLMTRDSGVEPRVIAKIINEDESLSGQQQEALSHLTLTDSGIKILKGRAGSGKSHVLGKLASIANYFQINVIALAPTHKASRELARVGYDKCDTIKGFLFKLYNSKVDLPKNSLIVIDEAGMVGNDDYSEVLRIAASRSCNVILSGDERQLSSIGRGGMFEVFADKFGSYEMNDIRRQESQWSKDIALAFSEGNIRRGIDILKSNNRLNNADTKIDSMESLLNSWNSSSEAVENRLIIAVKNTDVDTLNAGARELLKAKNILSGSEVLITKDGKNYCFMKNDRIVFNQSNKEIGVSNGDFGIVKSLSSSKFTVMLDNKKEVEFNLSEFSGFKHGYASTVYKAQGSSIRDVYVLHDGFSTSKNSYVAMSRHIKDIHLYTNKVATKTDNHLIKQLGFNPEAGSSLNYYTKEDLEVKSLSESKGVFAKTVDRLSEKLKSGITLFIDKSSVDRDYYVFEKPEVSKAEAFEILELVNEYNESQAKSSSSVEGEEAFILEERAVANGYNINQKGGGNNITKSSNNITAKSGNDIATSNPNTLSQQSPQFTNTVSSRKQSMTPKERFYANRDYLLKKQAANNVDYEQENQNLRQEIKWNAERIALNLLGLPNKRLSDGKQLRFGEQGGVAVMISGEKRGNWYDFEKGTGGDLFDLVCDVKTCDFKEAADYLREVVGIDNKISNIVNLHDFNDRYVDHHKEKLKEKAEEIASAKKTETLYAKSKAILYTSTAARYLVKTRKIDFAAFQEKIGDDIRTTTIYEPILQKTLPAIVAFARNKDGKITGGQQLLLSSNPLGKASVDNPRKSFGKITGSFVEISSPNRNIQNLQNQFLKDHNTITVIAEGLETALSIQYAGIDAKIICSLGIHNIKNYVPQEGEQIIIAADNDGKDATTNKTIIEASDSLRVSGAMVKIARPEQVGDFNDILQRNGIGGILEIREIFNPVINSFKAKTVDEFLDSEYPHNESLKDTAESVTSKLQDDLSYIRKYNISEEELLESFKSSYLEGLNCLKATKEQAVNAEQIIQGRGERMIKEARLWGSNLRDSELINELIAIPQSERLNYLEEHRSETLNSYLKLHLNNFDTKKLYSPSVAEVFEVVEKEQKFLAELGSNIQDKIYEYKVENSNSLRAARAIYEKPQLFTEVRAMAEQAIETGALHLAEVSYLFKNELNMSDVYQNIDTAFEKHHIKTNLRTFHKEKSDAETPREFLKTAQAEQEFLVGLDGNLKYSSHDNKLQAAITRAHTEQKEGVIDRLEKIIDRSIDIGIITNARLIYTLQKTVDLKNIYVNLDSLIEVHEIKTNLNNFAVAKLEAKLPEELIAIFTKEQKYLAELNDIIKYPDQHSKDLLDRVEGACKGHQNNIISILGKTAEDAIKTGFKDSSTIIEELKNAPDLNSAYFNLDSGLENHRVQTTLNNFSIQKAEAKTIPEILQITASKEEFLSSLHSNIKYPELQSQTLLDSIGKAHQGGQDNVIQELTSLTTHITEHKIRPEQDLLEQLKNSEDTHATIKELTKLAVEHHGSFVNKNLIGLIKHERCKMGDITFDCPMKYLKHEIENPAHAYVDIAAYKRAIPRVQEIMNKLELKKEHEHSMGGMSM